MTSTQPTRCLLEMSGIVKTFPGVRALSGVDFSVSAGEIHALMGENGAGKSTLIKVLTGVYPRDEGQIVFDGKVVAPSSPRQAEELGISTVYQEVNLVPNLSVAENILLGRQPSRWGLLDWKAIRCRAKEAMARIGLQIDVDRDLASCSIAVQQLVAIARALDVEAKFLVLDEPTSSLDKHEAQELFQVLRRLRDQGLGILFVTHFLGQAYELSDRITVLRNGELVGTFDTQELPRLQLVAHMLGKPAAEVQAAEAAPHRPSAPAARAPFLETRGLSKRGSIEPLNLDLAAGEVAGLAGLVGSGRTEIARLLFGIDRADSGQIRLDGVEVEIGSPRKAIALHIALCPEDRKTEGLVPALSVRENLILALQARRGALSPMPRAEQLRIVDHYIEALSIKTPSPETAVADLSGGNQQKVLLARWLAMEPRLIILDEPTRGVDIGAKAEIEKLVGKLRDQGKSILFVSSELDEVVRSCQRVHVLRDRRQVGELVGAAISEDRIMQTIARSHQEETA